MALPKLLQWLSGGGYGELNPVQSSAGASSAGSVPALNGNGLIDPSMLGGNVDFATIETTALAQPGAPSVAFTGTAGTTSYGYNCTAVDANGFETTVSATTTITTGSASLSTTNYFTITPPPVQNAASFNIYRVQGGGSTGKIGNVAPGASFSDTGFLGSGAAPAVNNTGSAIIAGEMLLGVQGVKGAVKYVQNGNSSFFAIYDGTKFFGISPVLPGPTGTSCVGGFYNGMGISGASSNTNTPIFAILNTQDGGGWGLGHDTFCIVDNRKVLTFHNTLDDGAGNGVLAGALTLGTPLAVTSGGTGAATAAAALAALGGNNASNINTGTLPAAQLPAATTTSLGAVQPDGTTITITNGVISAAGSVEGTATLVSGTVSVSQTSITANTFVGLTRLSSPASTYIGELSVSINPGVGFTITSTESTDTSAVAWVMSPVLGGGTPAATVPAAGMVKSTGSALVDAVAGTDYLAPGASIPAADLTGTVAVANLPVMGASGSSHAAGLVPDPGATAGTTRYLREDGTWDAPPSASGTNASEIQGVAVSSTAPTTGQVLEYNGTQYAPATPSGGSPWLYKYVQPTIQSGDTLVGQPYGTGFASYGNIPANVLQPGSVIEFTIAGITAAGSSATTPSIYISIPSFGINFAPPLNVAGGQTVGWYVTATVIVTSIGSAGACRPAGTCLTYQGSNYATYGWVPATTSPVTINTTAAISLQIQGAGMTSGSNDSQTMQQLIVKVY